MGKKTKMKTMSLSEFTADTVINDPQALPTAPREDRCAGRRAQGPELT